MPLSNIFRRVATIFRGSSSRTPSTSSATNPPPTRNPNIPAAIQLSPHQEQVSSGKWITVGSSWIDQIRWDWRTKATDMKTIGGGWYRYEVKPMELDFVDDWTMPGRSPGRFWWNYVRGVYSPATRIRKAPSRRGHGKVRPNVIHAVR